MSTLPKAIQSQWTPYPATKLFRDYKKKKPTKQKKNNTTICRETQKPRIPKQSSERRIETKESTGLTSDYTTKLQSSGRYGTGTKTDIQMNETKQKPQK